MLDHDDVPEVSTPTLMRAARGTYARSMRVQLRAEGLDDLPRNGIFILAGIDGTDDLPAELGVSKQAVSQALDVLVNRGYVERRPATDDRRRIDLELTDRGRTALEVADHGVDAVDRQLSELVTPEQVEAMRTALFALSRIKAADTATGAGVSRPARQLRQFSPIFCVRDLPAALAHYADLGFRTFAYEDGPDYGFANREGTSLHLTATAEHAGSGLTYLYVADADALYEEWTRPGIGGVTRPVGATPYALREGSHVDPDGNLIRFGSPIDEG